MDWKTLDEYRIALNKEILFPLETNTADKR